MIVAQAVEHYEFTRYGSLISRARALGREDCANIVQENPEEEKVEEKAADEKLTEIAESEVNAQASAP
jgi:ferritin-like metal-binding protein YciE